MCQLLDGPSAILWRALRFFFTPRLGFLFGLLLLAAAAQAQTITSVFASPSTVTAGTHVELVVDISAKATSNLTVNLSSNTSLVPIAGTMTISSGNDYGTILVATPALDSAIQVTFTATLGSSSGQGKLIVKPATLATIIASPNPVSGGNASTVYATLNGPAGPSGVTVSLSSGNSAVASVPASVTIPANGTSASAPVATTPVDTSTNVTLKGTVGAVSQTGTVNVSSAWVKSITPTGTSAPSSSVGAVTLYVVLSGPAGPSGVTVNLSTSCTAAATLPAAASVAAGKSEVSVSVTALSPATNVPVVFYGQTAALEPAAQSNMVTVLSPIGSSWPEAGAGIGNTNFGGGSGATGATKWTYTYDGLQPGSPAIGVNGELLYTDGYYVHAISSSGTALWQFKAACGGTPAVGGDGTVYVTAWNGQEGVPVDYGYLLAFNSLGQEKWGFDGSVTGYYPLSGQNPTIGIDGTIYVYTYTSSGAYALCAINPDKSIEWTYALPAGDDPFGSPVCGNDGSVYLTTDAGSFVNGGTLIALNGSGTVKWTQALSAYALEEDPSVMVGPDNTVYFAPDQTDLYAVSSNGALKWDLQNSDGFFDGLAMGPDGTIYLYDVSGTVQLVAVSPSGAIKWKSFTSDMPVSPVNAVSVGSDGTIYLIGSLPDTGRPDALFAYSSSGVYKWVWEGTQTFIFATPVIGGDGTIYIPTDSPSLVAVH